MSTEIDLWLGINHVPKGGKGHGGGGGAAKKKAPAKAPAPAQPTNEMLQEIQGDTVGTAMHQTTQKIQAKGIKEGGAGKAVLGGSRAGADLINSANKGKPGHTVSGSPYGGMKVADGDWATARFAGVAYGSGASSAKMAAGAKVLKGAGKKALVVDDVNFKGIVFSD